MEENLEIDLYVYDWVIFFLTEIPRQRQLDGEIIFSEVVLEQLNSEMQKYEH